MNRITEKSFLALIKKQRIIVDPGYPDSAVLCFDPDPGISRFWEIPEEARRITCFIDTILSSLVPWNTVYVWKHLGSWKSIATGVRLNDDVQAIIYSGIGIPGGHADILEFTKDEYPKLVALIFNQLIFGWNVGDDLYLIPDHGDQIVKTDHHDAVHVEFKSDETMQKFVEAMKQRGFPLPEDVPDETFKTPDWIK
jgi:hypothetical protein